MVPIPTVGINNRFLSPVNAAKSNTWRLYNFSLFVLGLNLVEMNDVKFNIFFPKLTYLCIYLRQNINKWLPSQRIVICTSWVSHLNDTDYFRPMPSVISGIILLEGNNFSCSCLQERMHHLHLCNSHDATIIGVSLARVVLFHCKVLTLLRNA